MEMTFYVTIYRKINSVNKLWLARISVLNSVFGIQCKFKIASSLRSLVQVITDKKFGAEFISTKVTNLD
jgi:hypothetical protein